MSITSDTRANALLAVPRKLLDDYLAQAAEQLTRRRMVVGEQIRKAREAKRWKQKELATRVHVEPQTISNWERGVRVPDWDKLELLARELEQPLSYFVADGETTAVPDPALAAEVGEIRVLLEALAAAQGLDVQELLRAARPEPAEHQPEDGGLEPPAEAEQAV